MSRLRIAYWSPLPPQRSGIADYSRALLPHLATYFDLEVFVDADQPSVAALDGISLSPASDFSRLKHRFDGSIFQMGNSYRHHAYLYPYLLEQRGIVVLHDFSLLDFYIAMLSTENRLDSLLDEIAHSEGIDAQFRALRNLQQNQRLGHLEFPVHRRVIEASRALIVHNQWAKETLRGKFPNTSIYTVPMGTTLSVPADRQQQRIKLNLPSDAFIIGTFGHLNVTRRLDVLLTAFARLIREFPQSNLLLVGPHSDDFRHDLQKLIATHQLEDSVRILDYLDEASFVAHLQACDAVVNLRYPTAGASSSVILRAFGAGVPVIASDVPEFADLASEFCVLIPVGDGELEALNSALGHWAANRLACEHAGSSAHSWAASHTTWSIVAEQYAEIINNTFGVSIE